jgi:DtxR family transcriptional regulator, Mn-dependent transcriptional regulator
VAHEKGRSQSTEEYLESLFKLAHSESGIAVGRLAADLHVAPSSASQMLVRLAEEGLVTRRPDGVIALTDEGEREGARLVRRHRLSERFLADLLQLPWDRVHDEACKMEHALSPEVEAALAERLGHPLTCPHGHEIPDEDGRVEEVPAQPLDELRPGERGVIARVSEDEPDLLRYLASLGLVPKARVSVESIAPFGGPYLLRVGSSEYAVGREVAARVFVTADVHAA